MVSLRRMALGCAVALLLAVSVTLQGCGGVVTTTQAPVAPKKAASFPAMSAFDAQTLKTDEGLAMGPALAFFATNPEPTVQEWTTFLTKKFGGLRPLAGMKALTVTAPKIVSMMKEGELCGGVGAYGMRLQAGKEHKVVVADNLEESPDIAAWTAGGAFYKRVKSTDPIVLAVRPNAPGTVEVVTGAEDASGKTALTVADKPGGAAVDEYLGAFLVVNRAAVMFNTHKKTDKLSAAGVLDAVFDARVKRTENKVSASQLVVVDHDLAPSSQTMLAATAGFAVGAMVVLLATKGVLRRQDTAEAAAYGYLTA